MKRSTPHTTRPRTTGADRRARRRADARIEILRAAGHVFREHGYSGASMRDIADEADLSAANLYNYFRGKDEILFFCHNLTLDRLLALLKSARQSRGPLNERLRNLAVAHVLCVVGEVQGTVAHFEVNTLPPPLRRRVVAKRDQYETGVRALVAQGVRAGQIRPVDPVIATRAFIGALNWTAHWFRPDGALPASRIAELVADYAVSGLLATARNGRAGGQGRHTAGPSAP